MLGHHNVPINGLPLSAAVESEGMSVQGFVDRVVMAPNEQASLVVLVLAPALLGISIDVALFDGTGKVCLFSAPP